MEKTHKPKFIMMRLYGGKPFIQNVSAIEQVNQYEESAVGKADAYLIMRTTSGMMIPLDVSYTLDEFLTGLTEEENIED